MSHDCRCYPNTRPPATYPRACFDVAASWFRREVSSRWASSPNARNEDIALSIAFRDEPSEADIVACLSGLSDDVLASYRAGTMDRREALTMTTEWLRSKKGLAR